MTREMGGLRSVGGTPERATRPAPAPKRRDETVTYQVRIELEDSSPRLWRRLELSSDLFLDDVHDIIQAVVGWTDSHLHQFRSAPDPAAPDTEFYLCPFDVHEGADGTPERQVRLDDVLTDAGDTLYYLYDYGDHWDHVVELEAVTRRKPDRPRAVCTGGEHGGPAEDSRGTAAGNPAGPADIHDINRRLSTLGIDGVRSVSELSPPLLDLYDAVRITPTRQELRRLIGRARLTQPVLIDADTAARMVRPYTWLLDRVGDDGIKLTDAGYLPPVHVKAAMTELEMEDEWIGAFNRESQTLPVLELRESAHVVGLLRKYRGRLQLTARARKLRTDPVALWWHLAASVPPKVKDEFTAQASLTYLIAVAAGIGNDRESLVARVLSDIGWRTVDDEQVSRYAVIEESVIVQTVLRRLGAIATGMRRDDSTPTPEGIMFARAALAR